MHGIRTSVGNNNQNRLQLAVTLVQHGQRLQRQRQAICQRRFTTGRHFCQTLLRQVHAAGNRQQHIRLITPESNHTYAVTLLVRLLQHVENSTLNGAHTLTCTHGAAGIHSKQEGVADAFFAHLLA